MSLESDLARVFDKNKWTWNFTNGKRIPDENDIEAALDEAARLLYDGKAGDSLFMGRLFIVKKEIGHDVYVFAGPYQ